ncbi:MAG: hypothetical protein WCT02_01235 [Candidatus Paceibacterota bacterium]
MDEDIELQPQPLPKNPDPAAGDTETKGQDVGNSDRVFDITPDLNISPVKEETSADITQVFPDKITIQRAAPAAPNIPVTPISAATPSSPVAPINPIFPASNPLIPNQQVPAPSPITEKTPLPERYGPANPPTKTIGANFAFTPEKSSDSQFSGTLSKAGPTEGPDVERLRTYESDFAHALAKRHVSSATISIAESKKKEEEEAKAKAEALAKIQPTKAIPEIKQVTTTGASTTPRMEVMANPQTSEDRKEVIRVNVKNSPPKEPSNWPKNIAITLISLILIGGGCYAAYYLYTKSPLAASKEPVATPPVQQQILSYNIIPTDSQGVIVLGNTGSEAIKKVVLTEMSKELPANSIREIIFAESGPTGNTVIPANQMSDYFDVGAPDILRRSLAPAWMLGIYSDPDAVKSVFVITTNNFFQNAFAGMLQWENNMPNDLKPFIGVNSAPDDMSQTNIIPANASNSSGTTTTASSTPVTPPQINIPIYGAASLGTFKDRIVKNRDVREYIGSNGSTIFLYSFVDEKTLVIAKNESVLMEIIDRLEKKAFIR